MWKPSDYRGKESNLKGRCKIVQDSLAPLLVTGPIMVLFIKIFNRTGTRGCGSEGNKHRHAFKPWSEVSLLSSQDNTSLGKMNNAEAVILQSLY